MCRRDDHMQTRNWKREECLDNFSKFWMFFNVMPKLTNDSSLREGFYVKSKIRSVNILFCFITVHCSGMHVEWTLLFTSDFTTTYRTARRYSVASFGSLPEVDYVIAQHQKALPFSVTLCYWREYINIGTYS